MDNSSVVYSGAQPAPVLDAIHARAAGYHSSEDAEEFLDRYHEPTGTGIALPAAIAASGGGR